MPDKDSRLAALLLVNRLADAGVPPLKASEFWPLVERVGDPASLLGIEASELVSAADVTPADAERIFRLLGGGTALAFELDRLEQSGIKTASPFDDVYPQRLRERLGAVAPPMLHFVGAASLLGTEGIGVVGSRNIDAAAAEVAKEAAREAAVRGLPVISGGARGVDQLAMNAAFEADGHVVGVLADSLIKAVRSPDTRRAITAGTVCLCTPYKPDAPFNAGNAMGRNKIIYALSQATLVVASDEGSGGTWSGATEAIRKRYTTVAIWRGEGEGPGNAPLEQMGGHPVKTIDELFKIETPDPPAENHQGQLDLNPPSPQRER